MKVAVLGGGVIGVASAWYLAEAATALDLDLEDILRANLEKLERRYPDGFSTEKSVGRDKNDL